MGKEKILSKPEKIKNLSFAIKMKIAQALFEQGLTEQDLAQMIGWPRKTVNDFLNFTGTIHIHLVSLIVICKALDLQLNSVIPCDAKLHLEQVKYPSVFDCCSLREVDLINDLLVDRLLAQIIDKSHNGTVSGFYKGKNWIEDEVITKEGLYKAFKKNNHGYHPRMTVFVAFELSMIAGINPCSIFV